MWLLLALLAVGCQDVRPAGEAPPAGLLRDELAWTIHLLPPPPGARPDAAAQATLFEVERAADGKLAAAAERRAAAIVAVYAALAEAAPRVDEAALDALVAAEDEARTIALDAALAGARALPDALGDKGAGLALTAGALSNLVHDQARVSLPATRPLAGAADEAALTAQDAVRARLLDESMAAWRDDRAGWSSSAADADATLRAIHAKLSTALATSLRERVRIGAAGLASLPAERRAAVLASPSFRWYVGCAPTSDAWGFALQRLHGAPAEAGGRGLPPDARTDAAQAGGPSAPGPEATPASFPTGTGRPEDFPPGTGAPDGSPPPGTGPGAPASPTSPDGTPPPPENAQTPGPPEGAPPATSVPPPPDGAVQPPPPPEAGSPAAADPSAPAPPAAPAFNGVRPGG